MWAEESVVAALRLLSLAIVEHLIDFFDRYIRGPTEALTYDDGFRRWSYSGDNVRATAEAFAGRLAGLRTAIGC